MPSFPIDFLAKAFKEALGYPPAEAIQLIAPQYFAHPEPSAAANPDGWVWVSLAKLDNELNRQIVLLMVNNQELLGVVSAREKGHPDMNVNRELVAALLFAKQQDQVVRPSQGESVDWDALIATVPDAKFHRGQIKSSIRECGSAYGLDHMP